MKVVPRSYYTQRNYLIWSTIEILHELQDSKEKLYQYETPIFHEADNKPSLHNIENGAGETLRYLEKTQRISIPLLHQIFHTDANRITHVDTNENMSDIFTNFLNSEKQAKFCSMLGLKAWPEVFNAPYPF